MDPVKDAFDKVKQDIEFLKEELFLLRNGVVETRERMIEICEIIKKIGEKIDSIASTHKPEIQTLTTQTSTHNLPLEPPRPQNLPISTGNEGVSTDRQTDRQTDKNTENPPENSQNSIDNAAEMLESLDNIKKEIRLKFKRITGQELLVFSTIYQLDEEQGHADYKAISKRLNLTESSIRDYVGRLIKKGVPVEKKRVNNKNITLNISQNLKKIASLSTILQLREL